MSYGLQVFNSSGTLMIDISDRFSRFVEVGVTSSIVSGAYVDIYISGMVANDSWNMHTSCNSTTDPFYFQFKESVTKNAGYFRITNTSTYTLGTPPPATAYNYWVTKS